MPRWTISLIGLIFVHRSVANVGDVNGDGVVDLAVGCRKWQPGDGGYVWIVFLKSDGTVIQETFLLGSPNGVVDNMAQSITPIGDLNGDGVPDLVVGASMFISCV